MSLLHIHSLRLILILKANTMNPDQTAPKGAGSSLIWVHIFCSIGFHMVESFQDYSWIQDFEADFL